MILPFRQRRLDRGIIITYCKNNANLFNFLDSLFCKVYKDLGPEVPMTHVNLFLQSGKFSLVLVKKHLHFSHFTL